MNIFVKESEVIKGDQESVFIDTDCVPSILWTLGCPERLSYRTSQMSWRVSEIYGD
jgi:hypothetical protein